MANVITFPDSDERDWRSLAALIAEALMKGGLAPKRADIIGKEIMADLRAFVKEFDAQWLGEESVIPTPGFTADQARWTQEVVDRVVSKAHRAFIMQRANHHLGLS